MHASVYMDLGCLNIRTYERICKRFEPLWFMRAKCPLIIL